uniref:Uncharacterized protein n=1 Tax=Amphimedon queenslandica TaxID=400682 RepID=A0A1X7T0L9_AMPQE
MEDEPSSTFNDLITLMSKLGLDYTDSEETNGGTRTDSSGGGGEAIQYWIMEGGQENTKNRYSV